MVNDVDERSTAGAGASPPAASLERMGDVIADAVLTEVFPSRAAHPEFRAAIVGFARCAVVTIAAINEGRADVVPAANAPELGRWLAAEGFPAGAVRDTFWVGMRQVLDHWAKICWTPVASDGGGTEGVPVDRVTQFTKAAFDFTERGVAKAVRAHDEAMSALRSSGDLRRRDIVRDLLDGGVTDRPAEVDAALVYRLSAFHLTVVIDSSDRGQVAEVLRRATVATGAQDRLMVPLSPPRWTTWLGYARPVDAAVMEELRAALRGFEVRTAVGGPRSGVEGFRRAYEEARRVEELRGVLARADTQLSFRELALESVLLYDVAAATAYVLDELGELAADTGRAERMRETLYVWLRSGSQTATAARLGVHENTVRMRLGSVAETLGPDHLERRTELLVALRLCRALGASGLRRPA